MGDGRAWAAQQDAEKKAFQIKLGQDSDMKEIHASRQELNRIKRESRLTEGQRYDVIKAIRCLDGITGYKDWL